MYNYYYYRRTSQLSKEYSEFCKLAKFKNFLQECLCFRFTRRNLVHAPLRIQHRLQHYFRYHTMCASIVANSSSFCFSLSCSDILRCLQMPGLFSVISVGHGS